MASDLLVTLRRSKATAGPAALVATWMLSELTPTWPLVVVIADDDLVVFRLTGTETHLPPVQREQALCQLVAQIDALLHRAPYSGWDRYDADTTSGYTALYRNNTHRPGKRDSFSTRQPGEHDSFRDLSLDIPKHSFGERPLDD